MGKVYMSIAVGMIILSITSSALMAAGSALLMYGLAKYCGD